MASKPRNKAMAGCNEHESNVLALAWAAVNKLRFRTQYVLIAILLAGNSTAADNSINSTHSSIQVERSRTGAANTAGEVPAQLPHPSLLPPVTEACLPQNSRTSLRRRAGRTVDRQAQRHSPADANQPSCNQEALPAPSLANLNAAIPVPDRWRLVSNLGYAENLFDPYNNNNVLKGDRPVHDDWFFNLLAISDTIIEPRSFPVPVGNASTAEPNQLDTIGDGDQLLYATSLITEFVYFKGDTVFRPPDWEYRITPVFQVNYVEVGERGVVRANPGSGRTRKDQHIGWQTAFVDKHLRNVSDRYDFDSLRVGIQPFSSDFRGFLFQDQQFGLRLFGNRDNNIYQYNLAWFRRLEKDTNSGLNRIDRLRDDDVFIANIYRQDWPYLGFFSQLTAAYNRNREGNELFFDDNNFIARPASIGFERSREYDAYYLGYNGDGHFGRLNLTVSSYYLFGRQSSSIYHNGPTKISAFFAAAEAGFDWDWRRFRFSLVYASGDDDPYDDKETGYDAIFENPQIAGSDTSYWIRQTVPLIGGGRVAISQRNGLLNNLRSSKELGQSNFTNPGLLLLGLGTDLDLTPEFRLSFNANQLWFANTAVLEVARNQGQIDEHIGLDLSAAAIWRPFATQNIVLRLSAAYLLPGQGFEDLYGDVIGAPYSVLGNFTLQY